MQDVFHWVAVVVVIGAIIFLPRWFSFRQRLIVGLASFVLGWAGIFAGLAISHADFMQSEVVAYGWIGVCCFLWILGVVLLVPVFREWRAKNRRPRRKKEQWPTR